MKRVKYKYFLIGILLRDRILYLFIQQRYYSTSSIRFVESLRVYSKYEMHIKRKCIKINNKKLIYNLLFDLKFDDNNKKKKKQKFSNFLKFDFNF